MSTQEDRMRGSRGSDAPTSPVSTSRTPAPATPAHASPAPALHALMSPEQNVQRIMRTGTVWFAAAAGAVALFTGLLLSSGWRPWQLEAPDQVLWWVGSLAVALSLGLIGWSGCPILEVDVPTADRNKTRTMQWGTALFIAGGAVAVFAVMVGPVA